MSEICTRKKLRQVTGTNDYKEQLAILRRRGLNPFVCPKSGRPIIYDSVVERNMEEPAVRETPKMDDRAFA